MMTLRQRGTRWLDNGGAQAFDVLGSLVVLEKRLRASLSHCA